MTISEAKILEKARKTYGNKNQILVCIEELNELACVLAKYPRYENEITAVNELHEKALDEVADVCIILEHVKEIMHINNEELNDRCSKKIDRLKRWLESSSSMEQTTIDREV